MPHRFPNTHPIIVTFSLETYYITNLRKNWKGALSKITSLFLDVLKTSTTQKTYVQFSHLTEISRIEFWKKPKNVDFWGPRTRNFFFDKPSIKINSVTPNISVVTLLLDISTPSRKKKNILVLSIHDIFAGF